MIAELGFPAVMTALDKVLGYLRLLIEGRIKSRKERFEKIYQPIYASFEVIHADYMKLFNELQASFDKARWSTEEEEQQMRTALRGQVAEAREPFELKRLSIRDLIRAVLRKVDDPAERRFLWTVSSYFLEHERPDKSYNQIDSQIFRLLREDGANAVLRTPSSHVLDMLNDDSKDMDQLVAAVEEMKNDLKGYLRDISRTYAELQKEAYL